MGCVIANIKCQRLDAPIEVATTRIDTLTGVVVHRLDAPIEVTCSIICDIGVGEFIRFVLSALQWVGDDNAEGVVKYNKLTASGDWSLEEVEIEEML